MYRQAAHRRLQMQEVIVTGSSGELGNWKKDLL
jgi:hypothetical protein